MNRKSDGLIPRATIPQNRSTRDIIGTLLNGTPQKTLSSSKPFAQLLGDTSTTKNGRIMESLSVQSRITDSYGHFPLHKFCAESCAHDTEVLLLQKLLDLNPRAVMLKDSKGNLPLHIAVDRDNVSVPVVRQLLLLYSKSSEVKNADGDIPLFLACRKTNPNADVIALLLQASPDSASRLSYGCLPLHQLVHMSTPSVRALLVLIAANPLAAATPNRHGNLPLHLLCASLPCIDTFLALLHAYPEAISIRNTRGETPISVALAKQKATAVLGPMHTDFVKLMLRSSSAHTLDEEQKLTLRDLNWKSRRSAMLISVKCQNADKNIVILSHLYTAIPGVWRNILSML